MKLTPIVVLDDGETWSEVKNAKIVFVTDWQLNELSDGKLQVWEVYLPRAVINLDKVAESLEVK